MSHIQLPLQKPHKECKKELAKEYSSLKLKKSDQPKK